MRAGIGLATARYTRSTLLFALGPPRARGVAHRGSRVEDAMRMVQRALAVAGAQRMLLSPGHARACVVWTLVVV